MATAIFPEEHFGIHHTTLQLMTADILESCAFAPDQLV